MENIKTLINDKFKSIMAKVYPQVLAEELCSVQPIEGNITKEWFDPKSFINSIFLQEDKEDKEDKEFLGVQKDENKD